MSRYTDATTENLAGYVAAATELGADPEAFAAVRAALEHAGAIDPEEQELRTNLDGARDRVAHALAEGSVTVEQAREELTAAIARAGTDKELDRVLERAWRERAEDAVRAARAVPWADLLTPLGLEAAGKVETLGQAIPAGTTDGTALRASDGTRRKWVDFDAAIRRWLLAVDLLAELRRAGYASSAPIPAGHRDVRAAEWRWSAPLVVGDARELHAGTATDTVSVLAAVHAGARPTVATPAEVHARLEHRRDLREANHALVTQGFRIPGADTLDTPGALPASARDQLVRVRMPRSVEAERAAADAAGAADAAA